jgi:hypothetical protein
MRCPKLSRERRPFDKGRLTSTLEPSPNLLLVGCVGGSEFCL